jgi:uncharacterized protein YndB with AHSA1/START domain
MKGLITQDGRQYTIRFERLLDHPASRVWDALTQPALLVKWLASAEVELRPEGNFTLTFNHYPSSTKGKVTRIREYGLLEYTWHEGQEQDSLLTWELFPQGPDACLLVLTHTRIFQNAPDFGAGWHTHLDLLTEVLAGIRETFTYEEAEIWWKSKRPLYGSGS